MTAKFIVTPGGEKLAVLPADEYEDMRDALIHQSAMSDYRAGRTGALTLEEVKALLAAPTPLAFWRAKRGMTQAALAKAAGDDTAPHRRPRIRQARRLARNHGANRQGAEGQSRRSRGRGLSSCGRILLGNAFDFAIRRRHRRPG